MVFIFFETISTQLGPLGPNSSVAVVVAEAEEKRKNHHYMIYNVKKNQDGKEQTASCKGFISQHLVFRCHRRKKKGDTV